MYFLGFPGSSAGKESICNVGDLGLIAELGRFPGEGNALQYLSLENSMDREVWQATDHGFTKSLTQQSNFHFHFLICSLLQQMLNKCLLKPMSNCKPITEQGTVDPTISQLQNKANLSPKDAGKCVVTIERDSLIRKVQGI